LLLSAQPEATISNIPVNIARKTLIEIFTFFPPY
jgi:hypothetical protein